MKNPGRKTAWHSEKPDKYSLGDRCDLLELLGGILPPLHWLPGLKGLGKKTVRKRKGRVKRQEKEKHFTRGTKMQKSIQCPTGKKRVDKEFAGPEKRRGVRREFLFVKELQTRRPLSRRAEHEQ